MLLCCSIYIKILPSRLPFNWQKVYKHEKEYWEKGSVAKMRHLIYADWLGNFIKFISISAKGKGKEEEQTIERRCKKFPYGTRKFAI